MERQEKETELEVAKMSCESDEFGTEEHCPFRLKIQRRRICKRVTFTTQKTDSPVFLGVK